MLQINNRVELQRKHGWRLPTILGCAVGLFFAMAQSAYSMGSLNQGNAMMGDMTSPFDSGLNVFSQGPDWQGRLFMKSAQGTANGGAKKANPNDPIVWPCATSGDDGTPKVANKHGTETLLTSGEYVDACKFFVDATITSVSAKKNGAVTVSFTVKDKDGNPVVGVPSVSANIDKLVPASGGNSFNQWVPYIYTTETVGAGSFPNPTGTTTEQGYRESNGTFTDHRDGSYTYKFATNIASVMTPVTGTPISYDRSLTHRVSIMMGGHAGPTATAVLDFVPNGGPLTETRNIAVTTTCQGCHGEYEFHGHGGDRLTVENCVTCHNPAGTDAQSGETLDMKVMLHKIHAGGELASIENAAELAGKTVWEMTDAERADFYAIWGYRTTKHTWWKVGFPAVIENCTKCHQGAADSDNWKNVPSRAACSSCHDDVDFVTGVNHPGGPQASDGFCGACHKPDDSYGFSFGGSVAEVHNWTQHDQRNIPEFDVDLTVSTPGNGMYFVPGESPVVSITLTDVETSLLIDHTTAVKDTDGKEGCTDPSACPARDGKFDHIYLMVHGPRAMRGPVLSTAARADIVGGAGPFDLSSAANLQLRVDNEMDITVTVSGAADSATASATDVVNWLNGNAGFAARAIAYLEGGNVAIRSRNIGDFFALQLLASDVNTAVFGGDTSVYVPGGFYPRNDLVINAIPANNDPKASWYTDRIDYALDPVDDLKPGTYIASVEITDRGRVNDSNYKTPSVAKTLFQVKQAAEEPAPAGNCGSCHQGPEGTGFVLDYPRHHKIFDNTAVDQCGGCHDYQPQSATGAAWGGAKPIAKRVHAVHHGSELTYPVATVDHADTVAGRDWDIEFPQDIRNCDTTCHKAGTNSDSWKTEPARIPCSGCHDADLVTTHMTLMTFDPTPADPWSGDETETCKLCHQ